MKSEEDLPKTRHIDRAIGRRLREIRMSLGLTKVEVGAALSVSDSTVGKFEEGARIPASRLWQFCGRYGIDVEQVFENLPHSVGPVSFEGLAVTGGLVGVAEDAASYDSPALDPVISEITMAAGELNPVERGVILAAIQGIARKNKRK